MTISSRAKHLTMPVGVAALFFLPQAASLAATKTYNSCSLFTNAEIESVFDTKILEIRRFLDGKLCMYMLRAQDPPKSVPGRWSLTVVLKKHGSYEAARRSFMAVIDKEKTEDFGTWRDWQLRAYITRTGHTFMLYRDYTLSVQAVDERRDRSHGIIPRIPKDKARENSLVTMGALKLGWRYSLPNSTQLGRTADKAPKAEEKANEKTEEVKLAGFPALSQLNPDLYRDKSVMTALDSVDSTGAKKEQVKNLACLATVYTMISWSRGDPRKIDDFYQDPREHEGNGPGAVPPKWVGGNAPLDIQALRAELDKKRPVILVGEGGPLKKHFVLAIGLRTSAGNTSILALDPWPAGGPKSKGREIEVTRQGKAWKHPDLDITFTAMRRVYCASKSTSKSAYSTACYGEGKYVTADKPACGFKIGKDGSLHFGSRRLYLDQSFSQHLKSGERLRKVYVVSLSQTHRFAFLQLCGRHQMCDWQYFYDLSYGTGYPVSGTKYSIGKVYWSPSEDAAVLMGLDHGADYLHLVNTATGTYTYTDKLFGLRRRQFLSVVAGSFEWLPNRRFKVRARICRYTGGSLFDGKDRCNKRRRARTIVRRY